jgi:tetratricopeptide (TPR) repeat protein
MRPLAYSSTRYGRISPATSICAAPRPRYHAPPFSRAEPYRAAGYDYVARQHFTRALDLVSISNDRQLTAHVLASIGHLAHYMNEPGNAIQAAQAGLDALASGSRCPDLEARLMAIKARGLAALHDTAESVRSLLLAEKTLAADREEPCSEWVSGFDEGSLASEAARCMQQLGQLSEARYQAERVISLRPANRPRSRAFGMFIRAKVLCAEGAPDEASAVGTEILQATDALGSHIVVQHFLGLQRVLHPYRSNAVVAEFLNRLDPALRERLWLHKNFPLDGQRVLPAPNGLA